MILSFWDVNIKKIYKFWLIFNILIALISIFGYEFFSFKNVKYFSPFHNIDYLFDDYDFSEFIIYTISPLLIYYVFSLYIIPFVVTLTPVKVYKQLNLGVQRLIISFSIPMSIIVSLNIVMDYRNHFYIDDLIFTIIFLGFPIYCVIIFLALWIYDGFKKS